MKNYPGINQKIEYAKESINSMLSSPNCTLEKLLENEKILDELNFNQKLQN